jgi:hypothetical protein
VRTEIGKITYIGSWATTVVSVPLVGLTTLPMVMAVLPILPSIGVVIVV